MNFIIISSVNFSLYLCAKIRYRFLSAGLCYDKYVRPPPFS